MSSKTNDAESLSDAVDRFERTLDKQIDIINEIDNKAEHITRLLGVFIGAIISTIAVGFRITDGDVTTITSYVFVPFVFGVVFLIAAMTMSTVTYLSSKFKIGLHYRPANLLSQKSYSVDKEKHLRRTIGTYGYNIKQNKQVIEVNSKRFRYALVFLLCGVIWLSTAGIIFISGVDPSIAWIVFSAVIFVTIPVSLYILTGSYLTLDQET